MSGEAHKYRKYDLVSSTIIRIEIRLMSNRDLNINYATNPNSGFPMSAPDLRSLKSEFVGPRRHDFATVGQRLMQPPQKGSDGAAFLQALR